MANVTDKVAIIRNATYGNEVREGIASGIEAINTEVGTYKTDEVTRTTEFNTIKTDYDTYKNVMIATSPAAELQNNININSASLTEKTYQLSFLDKLKLKFIYGIMGDGTDETEKLRSAINAESIIYIPSDYSIGISSTIFITSPIKIYSYGGKLKAIVNGLNVFLDISNTTDFVIDGIKFDDDLKGRTCINVDSCTKFIIKNCYFTGYSKEFGHYQTDSAIRINTSQYFKLSDNIFENFGDQYTTITGDLNRCITINDNVCDWLIITGNRFINVNQALCTAGNKNQIISNNLFDGVRDNCIYATAGFLGAVIDSNVIRNGYDESIVIWGTDIIISNNKFYDTPNKSIAFTGHSKNVSIIGNQFNNDNVDSGQFIVWRDMDYLVENMIVKDNIFSNTLNNFNYAYFNFGNFKNLIFKNNIIKVATEAFQKILALDGTTQMDGVINDNKIIGTIQTAKAMEINNTCITVNLLYKDNEIENCRTSYNDKVSYKGMNAQLNGLSYINQTNMRTELYSGTAPTVNTWYQGDIVWNTNPTPGAFIGWVCTSTGSPGTWKGFGLIQA